jgi:choline dehydrogenase-like flavoprotein
MGSADDPAAVVDERCRVIGYEALLVCDASVMPNVPRANTHLPTVMIAERVAAWLAEADAGG